MPPTSPSGRPRLFYGWYVLAASVVIELFGLGFGIFAITTVYPYIIDSFPAWSRSTVFLPTSLIILLVGLLSPVTGWLLDRYSIRWLFTIGIVVQGIALYLFAQVQTPAQYVTSALLLGVGMSAVTILPNQVLVSRWFHARVGLVNGIVLAATALGAAMAPALITRLIEALDWRSAFRIMALVATLPPLAAVLLVVRGRPEEMGLRPYGAGEPQRTAALPLAGIELGTAARLPVFWVFAAAIFLGGMPCYAFNKHILVFLKELGFDPVRAADHKSVFFFVSACARLVFGVLADRLDRRNLLLAEIVLIAGGFPLLFLVPAHPQLLVPALLLFGAGYGGLLPSIPILAVHYFGRRHLGAILGAYKVSYDLAAAGAPLFTAALYDHYGSYTVAMLALTAFAWIAVVLVAFGMPHALAEPAMAVSNHLPAVSATKDQR
jgi:MFS family permease